MFENIIQRSHAAITARAANPWTFFQDSVAAIEYNNNLRKTAPTLEKLSTISLDKSYKIFKERFADASNFTFVFVSNIDIESIKPLLNKYLASLPATYSHEQFMDLKIKPVEGPIKKSFYKGKDTIAAVNLKFRGTYSYTRENNLAMMALKEVIEIRLLERLREQESQVYFPKMAVYLSQYPEPEYNMFIYFACAPDNAEKLILSTMEEIDLIRNKAISNKHR